MSSFFVAYQHIKELLGAFLLNIKNVFNDEQEREPIMTVDGIEQSGTRITVRHHKACKVITKGDPKGQIFLVCKLTESGLITESDRI